MTVVIRESGIPDCLSYEKVLMSLQMFSRCCANFFNGVSCYLEQDLKSALMMISHFHFQIAPALYTVLTVERVTSPEAAIPVHAQMGGKAATVKIEVPIFRPHIMLF